MFKDARIRALVRQLQMYQDRTHELLTETDIMQDKMTAALWRLRMETAEVHKLRSEVDKERAARRSLPPRTTPT